MAGAVNYKQVLLRYRELPVEIRKWLDIVPELIENYEWQVSISFVFSRIETIKHETLYKGLVKRHRTDAELTRQVLDRDHMSRSRFRELFEIIFDTKIPDAPARHLEIAEKLRDRVAHGKILTEAQARECLVEAFAFMQGFDAFVFDIAGFRPFGEGRGFKGRGQSLSKETSRWVLKGMGIPKTSSTA